VRSGTSDRHDGENLRGEIEGESSGGQRKSGGASAETTMVHGGMAHMARHGQAAVARGVPTGGLGRGSGRLRTGVS
jgi:hypothetical protein